jgi:hypothetical protein
MRIFLSILPCVALGILASCTAEEACSPELYAKKYADLVAKVSSFSTRDAAKRDAVIEGLYAVLDAREAAGADGDLSANLQGDRRPYG